MGTATAAISLGVYGVYGPREDKKVRLYSGNVDGDIVEFEIDDTTVEKEKSMTISIMVSTYTSRPTCHLFQALHQVPQLKCSWVSFLKMNLI